MLSDVLVYSDVTYTDSLDDTLFNRLMLSIDCEDEFHKNFWIKNDLGKAANHIFDKLSALNCVYPDKKEMNRSLLSLTLTIALKSFDVLNDIDKSRLKDFMNLTLINNYDYFADYFGLFCRVSHNLKVAKKLFSMIEVENFALSKVNQLNIWRNNAHFLFHFLVNASNEDFKKILTKSNELKELFSDQYFNITFWQALTDLFSSNSSAIIDSRRIKEILNLFKSPYRQNAYQAWCEYIFLEDESNCEGYLKTDFLVLLFENKVTIYTRSLYLKLLRLLLADLVEAINCNDLSKIALQLNFIPRVNKKKLYDNFINLPELSDDLNNFLKQIVLLSSNDNGKVYRNCWLFILPFAQLLDIKVLPNDFTITAEASDVLSRIINSNHEMNLFRNICDKSISDLSNNIFNEEAIYFIEKIQVTSSEDAIYFIKLQDELCLFLLRHKTKLDDITIKPFHFLCSLLNQDNLLNLALENKIPDSFNYLYDIMPKNLENIIYFLVFNLFLDPEKLDPRLQDFDYNELFPSSIESKTLKRILRILSIKNPGILKELQSKVPHFEHIIYHKLESNYCPSCGESIEELIEDILIAVEAGENVDCVGD